MRFRVIIWLICCAVISAPLPGFGESCLSDYARQADKTVVDKALKKAKEMEKELTVPDLSLNEESVRRAKEAARLYHSMEYQARIKRHIERLKKTVFKDALKEHETLLSKTPPQRQYNHLMPDERIYIFISSSIPVDTLRNYAADLHKLKDPQVVMVMRGFVKGMKLVKPTLEFLGKVLVRDPGCDLKEERCTLYEASIHIDPLLFRRYRVQEVPAILYAKGLRIQDSELSEGLEDNARVSEAFMVTGDVSLEYALSKIEREARSETLTALLNELRRGYY